ncbi:MAG: hypothetical protein ACI4OT_00445 [Bacilli bacterium]
MNKKEKIILTIIFIVVIFIMGFSIKFIVNSNSLKKYSSDKITFNYDNSWTVTRNENNFYLVDKNGSSIIINITSIDTDSESMSVEEVNSSIIYKLLQDNDKYKKIAEESCKMTSVYYDGYKTLLENDANQSLIYVTMTSDYILTVNYSALNKYFDLGIDSVENIVGSIAI